MVQRGSRGQSLAAFGAVLARRGMAAKAVLGFAAACVVGFSLVAVVVARRGREGALEGVPIAASTALALGAGVSLAFVSSSRAFRQDARDGSGTLMRMHGVSVSAYAWARLAGLAATLAGLVGGGGATVGLVAVLAAHGKGPALRSGQAGLAALLFGVAFAITLAPVAMATLGNRSRAGGYFTLLAVLAAPPLAGPTLTHVIPARWAELCSVPGALLAFREALTPGTFDLPSLGRATVVLAALVLAALAVVRVELARSSQKFTS